MSDWGEILGSAAYASCMAGFAGGGAVIGLNVGRAGAPLIGPWGMLATTVAGAGWGLYGGYMKCPQLIQPIKNKLGNGAALTPHEMVFAVDAMSKYTGRSAQESVRLLAQTRAQYGKPLSGAPPSPYHAATTVLAVPHKPPPKPPAPRRSGGVIRAV